MNPYRIEGPALISFSGGRTSAYMLHEILRAYDGKLPDDVVVAFANTGKEREETLRFVHEVEIQWSVPVHWIEYRKGEAFERVGYNSASRNGEPFDALIKAKSFLPNGRARFCTQHLKVEPLAALALSLGWTPSNYTEVIGLRADEGLRIFKGMENAQKFKRRCVYPLSKARVVKADVMAFWSEQPFDLGLEPWEGNCDLCFLKGAGIRRRIIRDDPSRANWWDQKERQTGGSWTTRATTAELVQQVRQAPTLFDDDDIQEYDVECGLHCASEAA